ncbi:MAG: hypothetical protein BWY85_00069 [Firmicutes bacterium ADurb.Bin506]|nr:MAG: hypothetical protein BWY85_00069 [Firmicutes bacterium ADurb.Bin506]
MKPRVTVDMIRDRRLSNLPEAQNSTGAPKGYEVQVPAPKARSVDLTGLVNRMHNGPKP